MAVRVNLPFNKITLISPGVFDHLRNLSSLVLQTNMIQTIHDGSFSSLSTLKELYLERNKLRSVTVGMFRGLIQLSTLKLESNEIATIEMNSFYDLKALSNLILRGNELATLSWTVFGSNKPNVSEQFYIWLTGNPLVCNSMLCWIEQGIRQRWIIWASIYMGQPSSCIEMLRDDSSCSHIGTGASINYDL